MGKGRKENRGKGNKGPVDKRPGQLIALLVILGISIFTSLYLWYFYAGVVGGNSLPVPAEALPAYRMILFVTALLFLVVFALLFFGKKAGFWAAAVLYGLDILGKLLARNLFGCLVSGLCLYFLLCQPTRFYFRIGQFKAFEPRKK